MEKFYDDSLIEGGGRSSSDSLFRVLLQQQQEALTHITNDQIKGKIEKAVAEFNPTHLSTLEATFEMYGKTGPHKDIGLMGLMDDVFLKHVIPEIRKLTMIPPSLLSQGQCEKLLEVFRCVRSCGSLLIA